MASRREREIDAWFAPPPACEHEGLFLRNASLLVDAAPPLLPTVPLAAPPAGLTSTLRDFQRACLTWLCAREACAHGGILADEMGLGKTVETIALILARPYRAPAAPRAQSRASTVDGASPLPQTAFAVRPSRATLILCPASIVSQWEAELALHAPSLVVRRFAGSCVKPPARNPTTDELLDSDVVLTSLDELGAELNLVRYTGVRAASLRQPKKLKVTPSPLREISFWRVVLDEVQLAPASRGCGQAARLIAGLHRWSVTGTPVSSSVNDLTTLLSFALGEAWLAERKWPSLLQDFGAQKAGSALAILRLLRGVLWRQSKAAVADQLLLPPQSEQLLLVELSAEERELHASFVAPEARAAIGSGSGVSRTHVLQQLRRTLLCPSLSAACSYTAYRRRLVGLPIDWAPADLSRVVMRSAHEMLPRACADVSTALAGVLCGLERSDFELIALLGALRAISAGSALTVLREGAQACYELVAVGALAAAAADDAGAARGARWIVPALGEAQAGARASLELLRMPALLRPKDSPLASRSAASVARARMLARLADPSKPSGLGVCVLARAACELQRADVLAEAHRLAALGSAGHGRVPVPFIGVRDSLDSRTFYFRQRKLLRLMGNEWRDAHELRRLSRADCLLLGLSPVRTPQLSQGIDPARPPHEKLQFFCEYATACMPVAALAERLAALAVRLPREQAERLEALRPRLARAYRLSRIALGALLPGAQEETESEAAAEDCSNGSDGSSASGGDEPSASEPDAPPPPPIVGEPAELFAQLSATPAPLYCSSAKLSCLVRLLHHLAPERAVVFVQSKEAVRLVVELLIAEQIGAIGLSTARNKTAHAAFTRGDGVRALVLHSGSAAAGLTLTAAAHVIILEVPDDPTQELQAASRVHRISQARPSTVWRIVAGGSAEVPLRAWCDTQMNAIRAVKAGADETGLPAAAAALSDATAEPGELVELSRAAVLEMLQPEYTTALPLPPYDAHVGALEDATAQRVYADW